MTERACGPLVLHEPLIAATVTGLLLGCPGEGLLVGVWLQAVWPGLVPMGGARQPEEGTGAAVGVWWLLLLPAGSDPSRLFLALAAALTAAAWGDRTEQWLRRRCAGREATVGRDPERPGFARDLCRAVTCGAIEAGAKGPLLLTGAVGLPLAVGGLLATLGLWRGAFASPALATGAGVEPRTSLLWLLALPGICFALGGSLRGRLPRARQALRSLRPQRVAACDAPAQRLPSADRLLARMPAPIIRLLLLQASFSEAGLQRSGFLFALISDREASTTPARRALRQAIATGVPPNTHPIMAAALLGGLLRITDAEAGHPPPRPPARLLEVGGPLLAQWGDRALWGAVRPASALAALALLPLAPVWVVALLLLGGCGAHLLARAQLFRWGYRSGWALVQPGDAALREALPIWGEMLLPLLTVVAAAALALWVTLARPPGAGGLCFTIAPAWLILGLLLPRSLAARPLRWGWCCWVAAVIGAAVSAALA